MNKSRVARDLWRKVFNDNLINLQDSDARKEIVNQLYNLELIENKWTDDTNGLDAMIQLMKTSEEAEIKNIPMKRFVEIKKLIYYNYMDCRVIVDILKMLEDMI